jgi:hypothetical protein
LRCVRILHMRPETTAACEVIFSLDTPSIRLS